MRGSEMLTAERSADGNPPAPVPTVAAETFLLLGAGDPGPANFPLSVALAVAEFANVLSVWLKEKRWDSRKFLSSTGVISSLSAIVLLSQIACNFPSERAICTFRPLWEPFGHTPLQVFAGAVVGCGVSYFMGKIFIGNS